MNTPPILINGDVGHVGGSLAQLAEDLAFFQQCGYDGVEISVDGVDAIVGGRLMPRQVDRVRTVTEAYELCYTVHCPGRLNLAFPQRGPDGVPELELERQVFAASAEFAAAIGARFMVYHSGLMGLHQAAAGLGPLPDSGALDAARAQEVAALRELMPLAEARGVSVGMENRDPHPWELAVLRRAGLPDSALLTYHSGLSIAAVTRQIEEVDHPSLGMTLDLGHLFIAARLLGWNFLEAVRQARPHVRHIHAHDNCGRLGGIHSELHERIPYADGDVHLPPGWGCLPLAEALAELKDFGGAIVLEIQPRCREHLAEALVTVRDFVK